MSLLATITWLLFIETLEHSTPLQGSLHNSFKSPQFTDVSTQ